MLKLRLFNVDQLKRTKQKKMVVWKLAGDAMELKFNEAEI